MPSPTFYCAQFVNWKAIVPEHVRYEVPVGVCTGLAVSASEVQFSDPQMRPDSTADSSPRFW